MPEAHRRPQAPSEESEAVEATEAIEELSLRGGSFLENRSQKLLGSALEG
eukprot:CAMPEP_0197689188 /NCGR_PEP_ID=MMETSP1338-20131121/106489_1 /TAXON_ID=43686 ORGANISM="Pelagodinium beii, Strain RCC1491" /NCGR_SAMPLE_ID=MMETSP1338 /ASSEMBLY_ACC=CAM_ASM_000754 /LENGTH=49 /DNA_ID= /DNA_START= /DNA_END= /DNA_ORIENTATION=